MRAHEALCAQERLHGAPRCARLLPRVLKALRCCAARKARHHHHVLPWAVRLGGLCAVRAVVAPQPLRWVYGEPDVGYCRTWLAPQQIAVRHPTGPPRLVVRLCCPAATTRERAKSTPQFFFFFTSLSRQRRCREFPYLRKNLHGAPCSPRPIGHGQAKGEPPMRL